jgi:SAM-dependent methyltransferase
MSSILETIRDQYGRTATSGLSSDDAGVRAVAEAFGYTADELRSIPAQANMGLSCGNPVALAHLRDGEVVVDLGSGGGLDVFLAAAKVGPAGRAIGIDMTAEMIDLARRNAQHGPDGRPYANVEFIHASIDMLPLPDASADVVISNCVINLAPDKRKVFAEMFRVLRPGGRVAVSDIALKQTLPEELRTSAAAYVGCIAGAIPIDEYVAGLRAAGFADVVVVDSGVDLNAYGKVEGSSACCSSGATEPATKAASACCGGSPATTEPTQAEPVQVRAGSGTCCGGGPGRGQGRGEGRGHGGGGGQCCGGGNGHRHQGHGHHHEHGEEHHDHGGGSCGCGGHGHGHRHEAEPKPAVKTMHRALGEVLSRHDLNDYAASVKVFAIRPR